MKEFTTIGLIDNIGQLKIANKDLLRRYTRLHKNKRVLITISAYNPKSTEGTLRYINYILLPQILERYNDYGYDYVIDQLKELLTKECPYCHVLGKVITLEDLPLDRLLLFIEWCKKYSAEKLDHVIQE